MTAGLGTCIRVNCTAPAVRTIGSQVFCDTHAEAILAPLQAKVIGEESNNGRGRRIGPLEENWGATWSVLRCDACGATWGGVDGDLCTWCIARAELLLVEQRRIVLRRPDIDPNDARADAIYTEWAERLGRAVKAGWLDRRSAHDAVLRLDVALKAAAT